MEDHHVERDQPLTPVGRIFLRPEIYQIINCAIGIKNPIDVDAFKAELKNSVLIQHPRFSSLLVKDSRGREHWHKTQVNVDQHVIIRYEPLTDEPSISDEDAVNDYLADLSVSCPLSVDKPLWEIHLLMAHQCAVFRVHHALGDGLSLMSMLSSMCPRADDPSQPPAINGLGGSVSAPRRRWSFEKAVKMAWYTLVFVPKFAMRLLWLKDKSTSLSGGAGVELWPRKLATAKFRLDDMKIVKSAIPSATINDVLSGIVSYGLSKYLDLRSPQALKEGTQITGVIMVNLRPQPGLQDLSKLMERRSGTRWGNKIGIMLFPIYYQKGGTDPLRFVKNAKTMIDKKKLSLEAICSYKIARFVTSFFGAKVVGLLNYRLVCNTTFFISNIVGPQEEISFLGNPVDYIRVNVTGLPHAITMHMLSYAGRADLQILVAKDIISEPKVLAKCFEEILLEMKDSAEAALQNIG